MRASSVFPSFSLSSSCCCGGGLKIIKLMETIGQSNHKLNCTRILLCFAGPPGKRGRRGRNGEPGMCMCVCVADDHCESQSRNVYGRIQQDISNSYYVYNHVESALYIFGGQNRLQMCNLWPGGCSVHSDCFSFSQSLWRCLILTVKLEDSSDREVMRQ